MAKKSQQMDADAIREIQEQLTDEAAEKTADLGEVEKSDREKLVEKQTQQDITTGQHPQQGASESLSMGQEIARGLVEGLKGTGLGQVGPGIQRTYGEVTGKSHEIKSGDVVGYFPLRGGKGYYQGGWFKISDDETTSQTMNLKAVAQDRVMYDEGQGVLYHDLKFSVVERFSVHFGRMERRTISDARKHARDQAAKRKKKNRSNLVGVD